MNISPADLISLAIAVFSLFFAFFQYRKTQKLRDVYRQRSSTRYRDITETVSNLTEHLSGACEVIEIDCIAKSGPCSILSSNISAAMSLTRELIRSCRDLDDDYKVEFGSAIDPDLARHLDQLRCYCTNRSSLENLNVSQKHD